MDALDYISYFFTVSSSTRKTKRKPIQAEIQRMRDEMSQSAEEVGDDPHETLTPPTVVPTPALDANDVYHPRMYEPKDKEQTNLPLQQEWINALVKESQLCSCQGLALPVPRCDLASAKVCAKLSLSYVPSRHYARAKSPFCSHQESA
ncbi:hypothetical protein Sjap_023986 [Stephania japonica]|uniref:Uncharacterized protein n=1 Tax=Stephania japonica TaxID=461633 RepID=A0AAP0HL28_9MAGN